MLVEGHFVLFFSVFFEVRSKLERKNVRDHLDCFAMLITGNRRAAAPRTVYHTPCKNIVLRRGKQSGFAYFGSNFFGCVVIDVEQSNLRRT